MRKKKLILFFLFIVLAVAITLGFQYIKVARLTWFKKVEIAEYGLKISYPNSYEDIVEDESSIEKIASGTVNFILNKANQATEADKILSSMAKKIINVKSELTQMRIIVEGLKTSKTEKTIEEICKSSLITLEHFNETRNVVLSEYDANIEIDGQKAGNFEIFFESNIEEVYPGVLCYVVPLEDREITIAFWGTRDIINKNRSVINKIIDSIHFSEMVETQNTGK